VIETVHFGVSHTCHSSLGRPGGLGGWALGLGLGRCVFERPG